MRLCGKLRLDLGSLYQEGKGDGEGKRDGEGKGDGEWREARARAEFEVDDIDIDSEGEGRGVPASSIALTQHRDLSITATICSSAVSLTSTFENFCKNISMNE